MGGGGGGEEKRREEKRREEKRCMCMDCCSWCFPVSLISISSLSSLPPAPLPLPSLFSHLSHPSLSHPIFLPHLSLLLDSFYINPGANTGLTLQVQATAASAGQPGTIAPSTGSFPANTWTRVVIPLSSLSVATSTTFDGFWLQVCVWGIRETERERER